MGKCFVRYTSQREVSAVVTNATEGMGLGGLGFQGQGAFAEPGREESGLGREQEGGGSTDAGPAEARRHRACLGTCLKLRSLRSLSDEDKRIRERRKPGQCTGGVCGGGWRGASLPRPQQFNKEFIIITRGNKEFIIITPGNKAHTIGTVRQHPGLCGRWGENRSVGYQSSKVTSSGGRRMRRTFHQTRGRRRGNPGRDGQRLGGGQNPHQTDSSVCLLASHFPDAPVHFPNHQSCGLRGGARKKEGHPCRGLSAPHPFPARLGGAPADGAAGMEFESNTFRDTSVPTGGAAGKGSCGLSPQSALSTPPCPAPHSWLCHAQKPINHVSPSLANSAGSLPRLHAPWSKLCACEIFTRRIDE